MANLTKRVVDASSPKAKEYFVWCNGTPGFGLRVHPSGKKVFVAQVRVGRQTRRLRIGHYGPFTVDQARTEAQEIIRSAHRGNDPQRERREARQAITVSELCETYMEAARANLVLTRFRIPKRQSTVLIDEGRVTRHIVPLIGSILAKDLSRADVQRMVDQITQARPKASTKPGNAVRQSSREAVVRPLASHPCWAVSIPGPKNGAWSPGLIPYEASIQPTTCHGIGCATLQSFGHWAGFWPNRLRPCPPRRARFDSSP